MAFGEYEQVSAFSPIRALCVAFAAAERSVVLGRLLAVMSYSGEAMLPAALPVTVLLAESEALYAEAVLALIRRSELTSFNMSGTRSGAVSTATTDAAAAAAPLSPSRGGGESPGKRAGIAVGDLAQLDVSEQELVNCGALDDTVGDNPVMMYLATCRVQIGRETDAWKPGAVPGLDYWCAQGPWGDDWNQC